MPAHLTFSLSRAIAVLAVTSAPCVATCAYSQSFLFPGASASFESGLSQTNTAGPAATVTNPANLILSRKYEAYGDLSLVYVSYTYERSGYDPATLSIVAPPVNGGASVRPIPRVAFGLFVTPRPSTSAREIAGLPQDQGGAVQVVDIENTQSTFISGMGAAVRLAPNLVVGASVIESAEDNQLIVKRSSSSDPLVGMRYQGAFTQYMLGYRSTIAGKLILGGSLKTAVEKKYTGSEIIKGDQNNDIRRVGFSPSVLAIGVEYHLALPWIFAEVRREGWSAGSEHYGSGLPGATTSTALADTYIFVGGMRGNIRKDQSVSGSMGFYPANVDFGSKIADNAGADAVNGVQFGEFDNLTRVMLAGSWKLRRKSFSVTSGANLIKGWRSVPTGYQGAGEYSLTVFTVGAGGEWYF